jgi:hypothetical protein
VNVLLYIVCMECSMKKNEVGPQITPCCSTVVQGSVRFCGLVGRASTFVGGDVGSIPTCGALEVWQWTFGSRTVWLVSKSAGQPQLYKITRSMHCPCANKLIIGFDFRRPQ